jgi:hypothetical protein
MMVSEKETTTSRDESELGVLCVCLGKIPIGKQLNPDRVLPIDWDKFSEVDWEKLVSKAQDEGLAPLMYWVLSKSGKFSSISESARNSLRRMYFGTWMYNQNIFKELEIMAHAFKQAEIPLVVLKGACFAQTIYPDIGLRPMGDLDVLVPDSSLTQAVKIAESLGYEEAVPEVNPGLRGFHKNEICLRKLSQQPILLELHKALADESYIFAVPVDWFWDQTEPMDGLYPQVRFGNLLMFKPTVQVLYAASHAMLQHGVSETPLRSFYDLDRLIRFYSGRLDWDLLISQSKIFEWGSALDAALSKTVSYFGTPIPRQVLRNLVGISDRNQKLVALKQIQPTTRFLMERQKLLSLKGSARFRYLLALVVPSPSFMFDRYRIKTFWAIPVYYIIRWWDILKDGFCSLVSLSKNGFDNKRV